MGELPVGETVGLQLITSAWLSEIKEGTLSNRLRRLRRFGNCWNQIDEMFFDLSVLQTIWAAKAFEVV